jgi:8-hydroxy-5-deazaflavin:NADPH oxidoreductase
MPSGSIHSIAILGAGKLGTVLARLATKAGYQVRIAGSGDPAKIALAMRFIAPDAIAATAADAINKADVVILALPLGKYRTLPPAQFDGKLVIDAMNYWWEVDGNDPEIAHPRHSSSELIQDYLKTARVIKALSHMGYHHLFDENAPPGTPRRKAIAIAGNSASDTQAVATLVDDLGFDPVIIGNLGTGKILEPGQPLFGANMTREQLLRYSEKL